VVTKNKLKHNRDTDKNFYKQCRKEALNCASNKQKAISKNPTNKAIIVTNAEPHSVKKEKKKISWQVQLWYHNHQLF